MICPQCQAVNPDTLHFCGECGTRLISSSEISACLTKTLETPIKGLVIGSFIAGRYEILEPLGRGGMGEVYRVRDTKLDEEMALKLLKPEVASDESMTERFRNELKLARKISHKNVCRMHDFHEEEGTPFITMEYIAGENLKNRMKRLSKINEDEAIVIGKQVCEGLTEAHRLGVVHRDLKPQNIIIDEKGDTKIMDFGIARSIEAPGVTQTGVIIGTPDYMSPEQAEGEEADRRSDIYALGVILYVMVTGSVPFRGDTALSVALKHKAQLPTDPRKLNPEITDDLSRLILICMEKDRERRYQTAEALLADLTNIQEGFPLGTKIRPRRSTFISILISKKLFIVASLALLVILFGCLLFSVFKHKEAPPNFPTDKPRVAILYFKNNTGDKELDYMREALSDLLITDLEQSKYLYVIPGSERDDVLSELDLRDARSYSSDVLDAIARRYPINHVVQGYFALSGGELHINISIQKAGKWETIASIGAIGQKENYAPAIDELTQKIKPYFNLTLAQISEDIDMELGKITTSSPAAYRYYSEGKQYHINGNYRKCIELMEKAVSIDQEFAMAYRYMAWGYNGIASRSKWREFLQKALELTDRVSERERLLIEGDFYLQSENAYDEAQEAYLKLLEIYPDDKYGNNNLGWMYHQLQLYDKAIERLNILIQNKDKRPDPYVVIAACYMAKGLYDKAKEILENYLMTISDNAVIRRNLSFLYLCQAKYDLALTEVEKAISIEPSLQPYALIGNIYRLMGDLNKAENAYLKFLEADEEISHYRGRNWLATFYLLQGKFRKSIEQDRAGYELGKRVERGSESGYHLDLAYRNLRMANLDEALKESINAENMASETGCVYCHLKRALVYKGVSYARMKSTEKALEVGEELRKVIQEGMNPSSERYYHYLMGSIEFEKNNYSLAIEHFKNGVSLLPFQGDWNDEHSFFMEPLAISFYKAGQIEEARKIFERILSLTTGRLVWNDIYARSFYMLGKIYEEKGWEGKAIEHYEKFLDLWKDADTGFPEIEDAKKRLVGLKNQ